MRFKIRLKATSQSTRLSLSYNSRLASAIELWLTCLLDTSSPPGFVFSRIVVKSKVINYRNSTMRLCSPAAHVYVSLRKEEPAVEQRWQTLVGSRAGLGLDGDDLVFEGIEIVEEPSWTRCMRFRLLSPAAIQDGHGEWLLADSPMLGEAIRSDLLARYKKCVDATVRYDEEFEAVVDSAYVANRGGGEGVMKHVRLVGADEETRDVRAFLCPITVSGNPDLIAFAHRTGIGSLGPKGLGMMG